MSSSGPHIEKSGSDLDEKDSYGESPVSPQLQHHELSHVADVAALKDVKKVIEVQNAEYAEALNKSRLNPWAHDSIILYLCCFTAFLCSCANGYDGSLMGAINAMTPFTDTINKGKSGSGTGLIFSIYTVGQMVGAWTAGPVTDRYGRRFGMAVGGATIIIGTIVAATANSKGQFIAGRFILGWGVCIMTTAAPSYCVEICPPQWRGRMTGFYNCGWFGGSIPAGATTLGTNFIKNNWSWRIPIIGQAIPSGIVICVVFFLPESPRWLYANGRDVEARNFLTRFHGHGDPNHPIVELELREFKEGIALNASDKRWWDYSELLKTNNARWRTGMMILMGVFGQFSGNGLGYFNPVIFAALGYDNTMQLVLNLIVSVVSAIGALTGVSLSDRMNRRPVLVIGTFLSGVMLAINAGLSAGWAKEVPKPKGQQNLKLGQGAVAAYFFFNLVYSFTYSPLQALYPVECLQTNTRAKGMAMYAFVVNCISWINLYCTPIAEDNIGYKYIYIFVGWDCIEATIWYFLAVETQGRTLEELEEIFSAPNPVAASKKRRVVAIREGGDAVLVDDA